MDPSDDSANECWSAGEIWDAILTFETTLPPEPARDLLLELKPAHKSRSKRPGRDSKKNAPDPYDNYLFELESKAYRRIKELQYDGITCSSLSKVAQVIERQAREKGMMLTYRNRSAQRRKPNAFYWLDSNWDRISWCFDQAIREVLNTTKGIKKRGPKPTKT
jgi:hypothetical protein